MLLLPNRKLYIYLLIASLVIVILSLLIPHSSALFSIVTGIGCGGFASVIVAWLIDEAKCKQERRKTETNRDSIFYQLELLFESGVQVFAYQCAATDQSVNERSERTWNEWIDSAFSSSIDSDEALKIFCSAFRSFVGSISEEIKLLRFQTAHMLETGLVAAEDMHAISQVQTTCSLTEYEFSSFGTSEEFATRCMRNTTLIKNILNTSPLLEKINNKQIGVFLYQTLAKEHGIIISEEQVNESK